MTDNVFWTAQTAAQRAVASLQRDLADAVAGEYGRDAFEPARLDAARREIAESLNHAVRAAQDAATVQDLLRTLEKPLLTAALQLEYFAWTETAPAAAFPPVPSGVPQNRADLERLMLQASLYPEYFSQAKMRIAVRTTDAGSNVFSEADFLGAGADTISAVGGTARLEWDAGDSIPNRTFTYCALWIAGEFTPYAMTRILNLSNWEEKYRFDSFWNGPNDLTVDGEDGRYWASTRPGRLTSGRHVAKAIRDPGAPPINGL